MNNRAIQYNKNHRDELSDEGLTALVELWQAQYRMEVDGFMGPKTLDSISQQVRARRPTQRVYPLANLPDGRAPRITSTFWAENPDRDGVHGKRHDGIDLMYEYLDSDPAMPAGDGGAVIVNGKRRFWMPPRDLYPHARTALAVEAGIICQSGKIGTGYRCWLMLNSDQGFRVGYFHLAELFVKDGQTVQAGEFLGIVGDNPSAFDPSHLHFELSPVDNYAPMNPRKFLDYAAYTTA